MNKLRHPVVGLIIFSILLGLCYTIYTGLEDNYSVIKGDVKYLNETRESGNIVDQLRTIQIIDGIDTISNSIVTIANPQNPADLVGALGAAGIGVLKSVIGVVTFPFQIIQIISTYYHVPPGISIGLQAIIVLIIAFLLLSIYLRWET